MCCFSKAVDKVSDTNIFARAGKDGRQFLVYSMVVKAAEELAMILPLPTPKGVKEDAVAFINLEKYPTFFAELDAGFPKPPPGRGLGDGGNGPKPGGKLAVVEVGGFVASFVPTVKDFARLDERFRLPDGVWDKLPQYKGFGFAVFQLKTGEKRVHPMAFEFPRADAKKLFFPTVHIHDGEVHAKADFDHTLYMQASGGESTLDWEESTQPAEMVLKTPDAAKGIVDGKEHVYRKKLVGTLKNEDVSVG